MKIVAKPNSKAKTIIDNIKYICIATVDGDGQPWNTPVAAFHFDKDYTLYWASWNKNQHSRNIRGNSRVFITVFDSTPADNQPSDGAYILAEAAELTEEREVMAAALVFKDDPYNPSDGKQYIGDYPRRIYKAVPQNIWTNTDSVRDGNFIDVREKAQQKQGGVTSEGAKKGIETKRKKYGDNFFKDNGALGGLTRSASGRAYTPMLEKEGFASEMGKKGAEKRWGKKDQQDKP